jgi:hypothetical protein
VVRFVFSSLTLFSAQWSGNIQELTILSNLDFEEPLLRGSAIAAKLGVDSATVRKWRREGAPCHKIGNDLVRYRLSEMLEWRAQRPRKVSQ